MLTLSTAYLAPIAYYCLLQGQKEYQIDGKEHYVKQTQRNRAIIYGANGLLSLTVPVKKYSNRDSTEDILISYEEDWQKLHWRAFESAYRNSAYFEFYEDDLRPFYEEKKFERLLDFNAALELLLIEFLKMEAKAHLTSEYIHLQPDWRILLSPKNKRLIEASQFPKYQQVFSDQYHFQPNLSIIDLLFNLGPASRQYLQEVEIIT